MAKIPPLRRLITEDFKEQNEWISKLLVPINSYFESNTAALSKGLTVKDNMNGDMLTVEIDGIFPVKVRWDISDRPVSVLVGDARRSDGAAVTLHGAVGVQWTFNQSGELEIAAVSGLLPPVTKFTSSDVTAGTDIILIPAHEFVTGDKVSLSTAGTLPSGLTAGICYIIKSSSNEIKLATTNANALAGTAVDIIAAGTGTHILTPQYYKKFKLTLECKTG